MASFIRAITNRFVMAMLIISIVLLVVTGSSALATLGDSISFEDLLNGEKLEEGDYVKGELIYSFGQYAAEDTYKNGVIQERNSTVYYVIPTNDEFVYYGLSVGHGTYQTIDKNSDETYDYLTGEGGVPTTCPEIEGVVKVMEGELEKYFIEWLEENDYTKDEIKSMGTFYYIELISSTASRIGALIGLILLAVAIISIVLIISGDKRRSQMVAPQISDMYGNDSYTNNNMGSYPIYNGDPYGNNNDLNANSNMNTDPFGNNNAYANNNANTYANDNTNTYANNDVDTNTNNMDTNSTVNNEYADPFADIYKNDDFNNIL